jgi:hypothetical protein
MRLIAKLWLRGISERILNVIKLPNEIDRVCAKDNESKRKTCHARKVKTYRLQGGDIIGYFHLEIKDETRN